MKKLLILSIFALTVVSCTNNNYSVSGSLEGLNFEGETIYLTSCVDNSLVDSTVIDEDGTFSFEGKIDTARYVQLGVSDQFYSGIVLEQGDILFDTMNLEYGEALSYGTPLNDKMKAFKNSCADIRTQFTVKIQAVEADENLSPEEKQTKIENYTGSFEETLKDLYVEFIKENNQTIISAIVLKEVSRVIGLEEFTEIYNGMGELPKLYVPLQKAHQRMSIAEKTSEGEPYTNFTVANGNIDGSEASLSDYVGKGKMVLVDFWASWCGPCIQEIPNLEQINKKYGKKVTLLSVAVWDKRDATLKAIKEHNVPWAQIIDAGKIPAEIYGITMIPHIMLIGKDGTILKRNIRGAQIEQAIKDNL